MKTWPNNPQAVMPDAPEERAHQHDQAGARRRGRTRGLAFRLAITLLPAVAAVFLAAALYNYWQESKMLLGAAERNAEYLLDASIQHMVTRMDGVEAVVDMTAAICSAEIPAERDIFRWLDAGIRANAYIYGGTVAFEKGAAIPGRDFYAPYVSRGNRGRLVHSWLSGNEPYVYHTTDWYVAAKELKRPVWSEPYYDLGGGDVAMCTYSVPIHVAVTKGHSQFVGVTTADVALESLTDWLGEMDLGGGYGFLISKSGIFVAHPNKNYLLNYRLFDVAEEAGSAALRDMGREMVRGQAGRMRLEDPETGEISLMFYAPVPDMGWSVAVVFPERVVYAPLLAHGRNLFLICLFGLLCLFGVTMWLTRSMTRPLVRLAKLSELVEKGRLGQAKQSAERLVSEVAWGGVKVNEYAALSQSNARMIHSLHGLLSRVQQAGTEVAETARLISNGAQQLEAAAAAQTSSTRAVGRTARDISARSEQLTETMRSVSRAAAENTSRAQSGQERLREMATDVYQLTESTVVLANRLSAINEKADNIGGVVNVIQSVADRVNLLALNAGIEAEKAGPAGVGFGVVAQEIRRLADQTAEATQDIERTVDEMRLAVTGGVNEMNRFVEQMRKSSRKIQGVDRHLEQVIEHIRSLMPKYEEVNSAMFSQSTGAGQISRTVRELTEAADRIQQALRDFNQVAEKLDGSSRDLNGEVRRFELIDDKPAGVP